MKSILVLDNLRSSHNVGSCFRTADGVGVDFMYLVGITPLPHDSFGRSNKEIAKTALGAEKTVLWKHVASLATLIKKLKKEGVCVFALEQSAVSQNIKTVQLKQQWALIVGNEVTGIESKYLTQCDGVLELPMRGTKESLNVSVAAGIALYQLAGL